MIDKKLISYYFLSNMTTNYLQGETDTIKFLKNQNFDKNFTGPFAISEDYTVEEFCNFSYEWDEYGFRKSKLNSPSIDNTPNEVWCFGDSFTMGAGVPADRTWPAILQEYTDQKVINFGVGGSGPETILRLLKSWLEHSAHKPATAFIYGFFPGRFEVERDLNYEVCGSGNFSEKLKEYPEKEKQMKHKLLNLDRLYTSWCENIYKLLSHNDIKYHTLDINVLNDWKYGDTISWGRDLLPKEWPKQPYHKFTNLVVVHPGINHHKFIAKEFSKHL